MHSRTFSCGDHASDSECNLENADEELEYAPSNEQDSDIADEPGF